MHSTRSILFVCKLCRYFYRNINEFLDHKRDCHFTEFQKTKCIVFEEKALFYSEESYVESGTIQSEANSYTNQNSYLTLTAEEKPQFPHYNGASFNPNPDPRFHGDSNLQTELQVTRVQESEIDHTQIPIQSYIPHFVVIKQEVEDEQQPIEASHYPVEEIQNHCNTGPNDDYQATDLTPPSISAMTYNHLTAAQIIPANYTTSNRIAKQTFENITDDEANVYADVGAEAPIRINPAIFESYQVQPSNFDQEFQTYDNPGFSIAPTPSSSTNYYSARRSNTVPAGTESVAMTVSTTRTENCSKESKPKQKYVCKLCTKTFPKRHMYAQHFFEKHKIPLTLRKSCKCNFCRNPEKLEEYLRNQLKSKYPLVIANADSNGHTFQCTECTYRNETWMNVVEHIRTHDIQPEPKSLCFECPRQGCSAKLKSEKGLKIHLMTHSAENRLKCWHSKCERTFTRVSLLNLHMELQHNRKKT